MPQERTQANEYQYTKTWTGWLSSIVLTFVYPIVNFVKSGSFTKNDGVNLLESAAVLGTSIVDSSEDQNQSQIIKIAKKSIKSMRVFTGLAGLVKLYLNPKMVAFERGFRTVHDLAFKGIVKLIRPNSPWSFEFTAALETLNNISLTQFLNQLEKELWQFNNGTTIKQLENQIVEATNKVTSTQNDVNASQTLIKTLQERNEFLKEKVSALWKAITNLKEQLKPTIPHLIRLGIHERIGDGWKLYSIKHPTSGERIPIKSIDPKYFTAEGIIELLGLGYKVKLRGPKSETMPFVPAMLFEALSLVWIRPVSKLFVPEPERIKMLNDPVTVTREKTGYRYQSPQNIELTNQLSTLENDMTNLSTECAANETRIQIEQASLHNRLIALDNALSHLAFLKNKLEAFIFTVKFRNMNGSIINYFDWRKIDWSYLLNIGLEGWGVVEFVKNVNKTNYFKHIKNNAKNLALIAGTAVAIIKALDYLYYRSHGQEPHQNTIVDPNFFPPEGPSGNLNVSRQYIAPPSSSLNNNNNDAASISKKTSERDAISQDAINSGLSSNTSKVSKINGSSINDSQSTAFNTAMINKSITAPKTVLPKNKQNSTAEAENNNNAIVSSPQRTPVTHSAVKKTSYWNQNTKIADHLSHLSEIQKTTLAELKSHFRKIYLALVNRNNLFDEEDVNELFNWEPKDILTILKVIEKIEKQEISPHDGLKQIIEKLQTQSELRGEPHPLLAVIDEYQQQMQDQIVIKL